MADSVTCPEGCVILLDGPACPHGVAWFHVSPDYDVIDGPGRPVRRELADFDPSTGHLHTCIRVTHREECDNDCAGHLYALAQDAEAALARVAAVLTEWDALSKHETGTTQRIRQAMAPRG